MWVLIFVHLAYHSPLTIVDNFQSEAACTSAGEAATNINDGYHTPLHFTCVRKG